MIRIDAFPYPVLIGAGLIGKAPLPPGRLFWSPTRMSRAPAGPSGSAPISPDAWC